MAKKQQVIILNAGGGGVGAWDIRCSFHSLVAILVLVLVSGAVYLSAQSGHYLLQQDHDHPQSQSQSSSSSSTTTNASPQCDLFSGKWIFDNASYPLYKENQCIFMSDQLACEKFGRNDLNYRYWRWQPHHCNLPR